MKELLEIAARLGVSVHARRMEPGYLGYYLPDEHRVFYNVRCTPAERRSVVAHELGHVVYGHEADSPENERKADRFAATLLIDPATYAQLEAINDDVEWLADEFNVTEDIIRCYRSLCLQRVGGWTYTNARMGSGQASFAAYSM